MDFLKLKQVIFRFRGLEIISFGHCIPPASLRPLVVVIAAPVLLGFARLYLAYWVLRVLLAREECNVQSSTQLESQPEVIGVLVVLPETPALFAGSATRFTNFRADLARSLLTCFRCLKSFSLVVGLR